MKTTSIMIVGVGGQGSLLASRLLGTVLTDEGYDVKLKKETADAWYFVCNKSKTNTVKDDPKKMDLVVSKTTYLPISTSVKEKGVTVTMRDFAVGVTEEQVTFDPAKYANAKIIDKR